MCLHMTKPPADVKYSCRNKKTECLKINKHVNYGWEWSLLSRHLQEINMQNKNAEDHQAFIWMLQEQS